MNVNQKALRISIHSLVKRETKLKCRVYQTNRDFNPLPRKEGDPFLQAI